MSRIISHCGRQVSEFGGQATAKGKFAIVGRLTNDRDGD